MPRFRLDIEYCGTGFAGWQRQDNHLSVQQVIEEAFGRLSEQVTGGVTAAGRTDAGVHASGQVAHVDLTRDWQPYRLCEALNFHLRPHPVAILAVTPVPDSFHARFSAIERRYHYRILNRRAPPTGLSGPVWHVQRPLDVAAMQAGARHLLGHHDFTTFRSRHCQASSPLRTMDEVSVSQQGDEILIICRARSFLHNQVRSIVGTLERVGCGAWQPDDVARALAARDRAACGPVAPPDGLCLTDVRY